MASVLGRVGGSLGRQLYQSARFSLALRSSPAGRQWLSTGKDEEEKPELTQEYFQGLVKDKPLVVFMKGDPSAPMCGFSRLVVQILHMHGMDKYPYYNVLEDADFKEGMKNFSNWPTFPQVYINGELVGGADIMLQLHQNGELVSELKKIGHRSALLDSQESSGT